MSPQNANLPTALPTTRLGRSGLEVSRLCLGAMSFGDHSDGRSWTLAQSDATAFVARALELGINFFDTAESYGAGSSETYLGQALRDTVKDREDVVVATKCWGGTKKGRANTHGLSRKHLLYECEASLKRLGLDYIDLYIIHRLDGQTPMEETLAALTELVRRGWVRYLGASSMHAWQFSKMQHMAKQDGYEPFISMQGHYNLMYREEEREMLPLCADLGVGYTPWSPLARGRLARLADEVTQRSQSDAFGRHIYRSNTEANDTQIVQRNREVAARLGITPAQCALAWMLAKPGITAPVVGATKLAQLNDIAGAVQVKLSAQDLQALEEPYCAHPVAGIA